MLVCLLLELLPQGRLASLEPAQTDHPLPALRELPAQALLGLLEQTDHHLRPEPQELLASLVYHLVQQMDRHLPVQLVLPALVQMDQHHLPQAWLVRPVVANGSDAGSVSIGTTGLGLFVGLVAGFGGLE